MTSMTSFVKADRVYRATSGHSHQGPSRVTENVVSKSVSQNAFRRHKNKKKKRAPKNFSRARSKCRLAWIAAHAYRVIYISKNWSHKSTGWYKSWLVSSRCPIHVVANLIDTNGFSKISSRFGFSINTRGKVRNDTQQRTRADTPKRYLTL